MGHDVVWDYETSKSSYIFCLALTKYLRATKQVYTHLFGSDIVTFYA